MGRSKAPDGTSKPTPSEYIYIYTELIDRMKKEALWMTESCLVMEKYHIELEKWKNHISIKG
jgi:hypothetical protein